MPASDWASDYGRKQEYDSLVLDQNNTAYYLNFGYDVIKATRVRLTPLLSVRWLRSKLLNYPNEKKIPLSQYLDERDLDLRFNQTIAVAGINLECLMYNDAYVNGEYWSIGLFGGYVMKLNQKPWMYSEGNRLTSDGEIGIGSFYFWNEPFVLHTGPTVKSSMIITSGFTVVIFRCSPVILRHFPPFTRNIPSSAAVSPFIFCVY